MAVILAKNYFCGKKFFVIMSPFSKITKILALENLELYYIMVIQPHPDMPDHSRCPITVDFSCVWTLLSCCVVCVCVREIYALENVVFTLQSMGRTNHKFPVFVTWNVQNAPEINSTILDSFLIETWLHYCSHSSGRQVSQLASNAGRTMLIRTITISQATALKSLIRHQISYSYTQ